MQVVEANYRVIEDNGRVAVERGPLLYRLEEVDQPNVALSDVSVNLGKSPSAQFQAERKLDLLGGVVVLHHDGVAFDHPRERRSTRAIAAVTQKRGKCR